MQSDLILQFVTGVVCPQSNFHRIILLNPATQKVKPFRGTPGICTCD
jgi:hypothetical protein